MHEINDFTEIVEKYHGLWVAFNDELSEVVASGKNMDNVYEKAFRTGAKRPTLFKVPLQNVIFMGPSVKVKL